MVDPESMAVASRVLLFMTLRKLCFWEFVSCTLMVSEINSPIQEGINKRQLESQWHFGASATKSLHVFIFWCIQLSRESVIVMFLDSKKGHTS